MGAVYGSLDRDDGVLAIGINRAVDLIARKLASVRTLGPHPGNKELVSVRKGRFGPYVQHGTTVANLPRGVMMDDITLEHVALLAKGQAAARARGRRGPTGSRVANATRCGSGVRDRQGRRRRPGWRAAAATIHQTTARKRLLRQARITIGCEGRAAGAPQGD
jgi:DNA topoisomerase-1